MNNLSVDPNNREFKKIICRRVPIKLQQFARLLDDLTHEIIDPVRVKAMESQIRRTRETCEEYGVESTATLLSHIENQLNLETEVLDSQKPLIKRFVQRLESHAERLKLGQINTGTHQAVKEAMRSQEETDLSTPEPSPPIEIEANNSGPGQSATNPPELSSAKIQSAAPDPKSKPNKHVPQEFIDPPQFEFKQSVSMDSTTVSGQLLTASSELTIFWSLEKSEPHSRIKDQLQDFGYQVDDLSVQTALVQASGDSQKVVLARLEDFPDDIEKPLNETGHFIVFSEHDTLLNRLKGIRLGSTLFFADPVDAVKLMEYLDTLEHSGDDSSFRVAVMEDSKAQARFNDKVLSEAGFETCIVTEPMELLNELSQFDSEVIFMDMQMPDCNGIELTRVLRQIDRFSNVPIIFLSAEENLDKQQEALTSGGTAFLPKPIKKEQLLFMAELYARRTRNLQPHLARDFHTGLSSASFLREQMNVEAERAMRQNQPMFMALIEIDLLSELNQTYGYALGDRILQQLARILRQRLRKTDCVGFFGPYQVGVLLSHCNDHDAEVVMAYLAQTFSATPIAFEGKSISVSLSIGLSKLGIDYDILRLVKRSLAALEKAKQNSNVQLIWAHEAR